MVKYKPQSINQSTGHDAMLYKCRLKTNGGAGKWAHEIDVGNRHTHGLVDRWGR
jgi:hypothetical protein